MTTKTKYSSLAYNNDTNRVHCFYEESSGSSDGSIYCNKIFHAAYTVTEIDFISKRKRILGVLYNEYDNRTLYFQTFVPLNISFTIPFLLEYYIYSKTYNAEIVKKIIMTDQNKKNIINYCEHLITKKREGVIIDYKH